MLGNKGTMSTALIVLFLLNAIPLVVTPAGAIPQAPSLDAAALSVTAAPPRLPADGNKYPSIVVALLDKNAQPSVALNDTTVYLTSSQENVGFVSPSVIIPAGKGFVVANITTTQTPGVTTITASASGIKSGGAVLVTKAPSGYATQIRVTPEPTNVLARPGGSGTLVVQLQDDTGEPAKASTDTNVSLSSSNNAIAQLSKRTIVVRTGSNLAIANFTTGYAIGSAFFTASSSGFVSGTAVVGVVGSPPFQVKVAAEPGTVMTAGAGRAVVWLVDPSGNPARAPVDTTVALTSSNLTIAQLTQTSVTIASGQIMAIADFTTTVREGTATVSASAQGLLSGFDTINTFGARAKPTGLFIYTAPDPVLADNGKYQSVLVGVIDSSDNHPDIATADTLVTLTSSNTAVGSITTTVTIPSGKEFATAFFASTFLVGTSVLTASAQGLKSHQVQASAFGPIPASVLVTASASTVPADGARYSALSVMLRDEFGNPAVAPNDIAVQLSSSRPSIIGVNPPILIRAGQTSAFANVQTGLSPGASNITASASGYSSSSVVLNAVVPAPAKLAAFVGPASTVNSTVGPNALLTVQLQDIGGFPARARQDTNIVVTSSNNSLISKPIDLRISSGGDYATAWISTHGEGQTNMTISAAGLHSSWVILNVLKNPINSSILSSPQIVFTNTSSTIIVRVNALNHGLKGAKVAWTTNRGTLTTASSTTDQSGIASTILSSGSAGLVRVTAIVTHPALGVTNQSVLVVVQSAPVSPAKTIIQIVGPFLLYIVIAVVVAAAAVGFLFFRKWRAKKKSAAESEETRPYDELEEIPGGGGEPGPEPAGEGMEGGGEVGGSDTNLPQDGAGDMPGGDTPGRFLPGAGP